MCYTPEQRAILASRSKDNTLRVLLAIGSLLNGDWSVKASLAELEELTRLTAKTVLGHVNKLEAMGELQVIRGCGRKNTYIWKVGRV